jgi:ATP-binding cassette subfamily B protein
LSSRRARPAGLLGLYVVFWRYAEGMRGRAVLATVLLLGAQTTRLAIPWLAAQALNAIQLSGPANLHRALMLILALVGTTVVAWCLHGPGRVAERQVSVAVRRNLADRLYNRIVNLPQTWHEANHSGETLQRLQKTSGALFDFAQHQFIYVQSFVSLTGPLVALTLLAPAFGALAAGCYLLSALIILYFDAKLMKLALEENEAERRYAAVLGDFLSNVSTLISLRLQAATRKMVGERLARAFAPMEKAMSLNEAKWCTVDLMTVVLCWGLVALYAWRAAGASAPLLIGNVFMVYQYAGQAGSVLGSLAAHYQQLARIQANFRSADPIWDTPRRRISGGDLPERWSEIEIRNMRFTYPGAPTGSSHAPGLHDVALTLRRRERIALVGPSGGGKSTLMRVLSGLYEADHLQLAIDGMARIDLRSLERITTLIQQNAVVFQATVRDNVTCGAWCDHGVLDDALRIAGFDSVLSSLPQGLETPVSEDGGNLSGGQRQRLSLARGIVAARGSSLVFFDEPTSSLDALTEAKVFDELDRAFPDACVVASVHRLSLLSRFDRVVLMAHGRVIDTGTPQELLERQPLFADLWAGAQVGADTGVLAA